MVKEQSTMAENFLISGDITGETDNLSSSVLKFFEVVSQRSASVTPEFGVTDGSVSAACSSCGSCGDCGPVRT